MFEEIGVFYRGPRARAYDCGTGRPYRAFVHTPHPATRICHWLRDGARRCMRGHAFSAPWRRLASPTILDFMRHYNMFIRMIGGLALLFGAWHAWHDRPEPACEPTNIVGKVIPIQKDYMVVNALKSLVSGFALTVTNPVMLFAVLAVVASFSHVESHLDAITVITGIFFGSTLWWFTAFGRRYLCARSV